MLENHTDVANSPSSYSFLLLLHKDEQCTSLSEMQGLGYSVHQALFPCLHFGEGCQLESRDPGDPRTR